MKLLDHASMKIVKLNRKFTINRLHSFEVGLKFREVTAGISVESKCFTLFGDRAIMWRYTEWPVEGNWASALGTRGRSSEGKYSYWIYLKEESMLSLLLLSLAE